MQIKTIMQISLFFLLLEESLFLSKKSFKLGFIAWADYQPKLASTIAANNIVLEEMVGWTGRTPSGIIDLD
ncbi:MULTISPECIES: hypothetical protein [unclassified Aerococcus]|uniref:hypothetical protein n=1 Tax=unclassified Aerococcus TaxID=2618060 RepID=UPI0008A1DEA2|nr:MULTISPECIES: hypothetical protein [unclassified Aerococcus]MDK6855198.1 hypothetical protein [Aerococcus sp. UMB7533]OFN04377.1 hypothetical protein HMPREF2626_00645 [Aerococcus sp. HMSC062A02]OHO43062.1 hypothetical protein HMPREF2705_02015 [Aerococcus sp. HMSC035B07]